MLFATPTGLQTAMPAIGVESTATFREAMDTCRSIHDDADLVSVTDQAENEFILTLSRYDPENSYNSNHLLMHI